MRTLQFIFSVMALVLSTGVAQAANKEDVMAADPEALARLRATNPQMKAISDEALAQAEIDAVSDSGETALDMARPREDCARILRKNGAATSD